MLLWLGSRSPPSLSGLPGRGGLPVKGEAIADRAPRGWRSLVALVQAEDAAAESAAASRLSEDAGSFDLLRATPLEAAVIGDPGPVERIAACLVFCNPVAGQEAEFNDWYSNRHLPDVLRVPGYLSAQRFGLSAPAGVDDSCWRYLAVYEVDHARYDAAIAEVAARSGTALMPISDAAERPLSAHFLLAAGQRLLTRGPVGF